jgi:hypothetical protein
MTSVTSQNEMGSKFDLQSQNPMANFSKEDIE